MKQCFNPCFQIIRPRYYPACALKVVISGRTFVIYVRHSPEKRTVEVKQEEVLESDLKFVKIWLIKLRCLTVCRMKLNRLCIQRRGRRMFLRGPRPDDVDVVAAPDAAESRELLSALATVDNDIECDNVVEQPVQTSSNDANNNCAECGLAEPHRSAARRGAIKWLQCDYCNYWYHLSCVGLRKAPRAAAQYKCVRCQ